MRPLLVGEAPTRATRGLGAFQGRSGDLLAAAAGLGSRRELLALVRAVNLLQAAPRRLAKGHDFPVARARPAARRILASTRGSILVAGQRAAAAFGLGGSPYFARNRVAGRLVVVIPHPSGVNRWWNEPANRRRARRFLRAALSGELA